MFFLSQLPETNSGGLILEQHYVDTCAKVEEIRPGKFPLNCGRRWETVMDKRMSAEH